VTTRKLCDPIYDLSGAIARTPSLLAIAAIGVRVCPTGNNVPEPGPEQVRGGS
jgi:hypothetical protein